MMVTGNHVQRFFGYAKMTSDKGYNAPVGGILCCLFLFLYFGPPGPNFYNAFFAGPRLHLHPNEHIFPKMMFMPFHRGKNIIFGSAFGKPEHTVECVKTEEVAVLGRFILRWRARTRVLIFPCPICSRYPDCASHFDLSCFRWNVK